MERFYFQWTDGGNETFQKFYFITEAYYSKIVGGVENRGEFIPYNSSDSIQDVVLAYEKGKAVGCAGLKGYSAVAVEMKRLWIEPDYRGLGLATKLIALIEARAKEQNYQRIILQTREIMTAAVRLYQKLGYRQIDKYPPYDSFEGAICFAKDIVV